MNAVDFIRRAWLILGLSLGLVSLLRAQDSVEELYPGPVPNVWADEQSGARPTLTVFRAPRRKASGAAAIVLPGGGYSHLALEEEGYSVARRLNQMGVTAFVLRYRLPDPKAQPDPSLAPLLDAQQALRVVRSRAAEFRIDADRVGLIGFSAGGHLAATAGTHFATAAASGQPADSLRPDFLVLVYPVISFADSLVHSGSRAQLLGDAPTAEQILYFSLDQQVSTRTPPTFLVHAVDDRVVSVRNSLLFYQACLRRGVPAELHLYATGGHSFGLRLPARNDDLGRLLQSWLRTNGWLDRR